MKVILQDSSVKELITLLEHMSKNSSNVSKLVLIHKCLGELRGALGCAEMVNKHKNGED